MIRQLRIAHLTMPGAAESSTTEYHDEEHKVETEDVVMELKTKATSDSPQKRS